MTQEQLSQLKLMSPGEIARKYTPLLIRGAIKKKDFDWLISQGLKNTSCEPTECPRNDGTSESVDTASQFTTHDNEASGRSQKDRLLAMLSDGQWHTTPEIMERVYGSDHLGLSRIPARANDLKNDGYQIESRHDTKSVWSYRLVK